MNPFEKVTPLSAVHSTFSKVNPHINCQLQDVNTPDWRVAFIALSAFRCLCRSSGSNVITRRARPGLAGLRPSAACHPFDRF